MRPVLVVVRPVAAAELLTELLEDYFAQIEDRDETGGTVRIEPIDTRRRGTVIYRVIQASRTVQDEHPNAAMFLVTEDGNRWRLPPPAL